MQEPYTPKHEYSTSEFVEHCAHFFRSPSGPTREALMRYFHAQYPSASEGCWKMNRCSAALAYLFAHLADFEQFVVLHDRRGLVSEPMLVALWRYFGRIPDEHLGDNPDPHMILGFAQEEVAPEDPPPNPR
jgi:hypothetical protein